MPIQECTKDGQKGYKWGDSGFCYIGEGARAKAESQGRAIESSRSDAATELVRFKDGNGFARLEGVIARVGVYSYTNPDGTIRKEFVSPETLFTSTDGIDGIPITIGHPSELVSPENYQRYAQGAASKPRQDGDKLVASLNVSSKRAQDAIESGTVQLSPGYRVELEFTPGVYNGEHYDAVQTKRIYNHLALVDMARGGDECRLNLDGVDCAVGVLLTEARATMATVKLPSGATVEVGEATAATAIQDAFNADAAGAEELKKQIDEAKAKVDELQGKLDAMEEEEKGRDDSADISGYLSVLDDCRKLKSDIEFKADGKMKTPVELMAEALNYDGEASADYLRGRLSVKLEQAAAESLADKRGDGATAPQKPALSAVEQHRQKFLNGEA